jgi:hypothetical protein
MDKVHGLILPSVALFTTDTCPWQERRGANSWYPLWYPQEVEMAA